MLIIPKENAPTAVQARRSKVKNATRHPMICSYLRQIVSERKTRKDMQGLDEPNAPISAGSSLSKTQHTPFSCHTRRARLPGSIAPRHRMSAHTNTPLRASVARGSTKTVCLKEKKNSGNNSTMK